jgi:hypothetical protein
MHNFSWWLVELYNKLAEIYTPPEGSVMNLEYGYFLYWLCESYEAFCSDDLYNVICFGFAGPPMKLF